MIFFICYRFTIKTFQDWDFLVESDYQSPICAAISTLKCNGDAGNTRRSPDQTSTPCAEKDLKTVFKTELLCYFGFNAIEVHEKL